MLYEAAPPLGHESSSSTLVASPRVGAVVSTVALSKYVRVSLIRSSGRVGVSAQLADTVSVRYGKDFT